MVIYELLKDIDSGVNGLVLDSVYEIEELLVLISDMEKKIDYLKGLKEYRVSSIDQQITKQSNRIDQLREIILQSMKSLSPDEKTLHFPDIGKVTRKKTSDSYEIEDEAAFVEAVVNLGYKDRVIEIKEKINLKEAKKLAMEIKDIPGTRVKSGKESVSISFEKSKKTPSSAVSKKSINDLDVLEV